MILHTFFLEVMAACIFVLYAVTPDARITRAVKALFNKRRWISWMHPEQNLNFLIQDIGTWTSGKFVDAGGHGAAMHLRKEADELLDAVDAYLAYKKNLQPGERPVELKHFLDELGFEMADIGILLLDIAFVQGVDLTDYLLRKHEINMGRKWSAPDEHGVQHHIEEPDEPNVTGTIYQAMPKPLVILPHMVFEPDDSEKIKMWREDGSLIKGEEITRTPLPKMGSLQVSDDGHRLEVNVKPFTSLTTDQYEAVQAKPDPSAARAVGEYIAEQADESDLLL